MVGIFCATKAGTDEEYRRHVRNRMIFYVGFTLLGIATAIVAFTAELLWEVEISSRMLGFYAGVGTGLALGGIVMAAKSLLLLKNEKKLHSARVEEADERNAQISTMASKVALVVLLVGLYITLLIAGLWEPYLVKILGFLVTLFLFSYVVAYKIISRRI